MLFLQKIFENRVAAATFFLVLTAYFLAGCAQSSDGMLSDVNQGTSGKAQGALVDPTGAAIAGATIWHPGTGVLPFQINPNGFMAFQDSTWGVTCPSPDQTEVAGIGCTNESGNFYYTCPEDGAIPGFVLFPDGVSEVEITIECGAPFKEYVVEALPDPVTPTLPPH